VCQGVGSDGGGKAQKLRFKEGKSTIFVGGGGKIAFILQPGGQNQSLRPVASVANMAIKQRPEGFGLKRLGDGVAAKNFEVIWDKFFCVSGGVGNTNPFASRRLN
jgi:hypothetical protein